MAYDFPSSPTNGQVANGFTWNGYAWAKAAGGSVTDGDKGDIVVSGSGATWLLDNAVTTSINGKVAKAGDTMTGTLKAGKGVLATEGSVSGYVANTAGFDYVLAAGGARLMSFGPDMSTKGGIVFQLYNSDASQTINALQLNALGNALFLSTTPSTSPTTGALTVAGGVGISGNVKTAGNSLYVKDAVFGLDYNGGWPGLFFDTGDYIYYNRTGNTYGWIIGTVAIATLTAATFNIAATTASSSMATGALTVAGGIGLSGAFWCNNVMAQTGYRCKAGTSGAFVGNYFSINHGTGQQLWIDATNMGTITVTSDYRIKQDVVDLPSMWERAKALRPVSYTHNGWIPEWELDAEAREEGTQPIQFAADDVERWGFIAHELQEALIEDAATGVKDAQNLIQSPNPWTVIATLTKALQEAMVRIEALETQHG